MCSTHILKVVSKRFRECGKSINTLETNIGVRMTLFMTTHEICETINELGVTNFTFTKVPRVLSAIGEKEVGA